MNDVTHDPAVGDAAARRPAILVLDDDDFMLAVLSSMLNALGYRQVATARRAREALERFESGATDFPDVVICDLHMPDMDGIEFLQRLGGAGFRGGVVLLSGEGLRILHTVRKLLGSGGSIVLGTMEKPAGREALRSLLQAWKPATATTVAGPRDEPEIGRADLEEAVSRSQWVLHFQPKVSLRTGQFTGVEALVRLMHPRWGLVAPDRFIGLAEEAGVIDVLTDWVLDAAFTQLAAWQSQGLRLEMAVNLSMDNLRLPGFSARVGARAARHGVAPQDVVLEITESRLMAELRAPLENLVRLRLQRFQLSIDDFGTGHSSLAQLRDVPFTELKIDRSFVRGALHNQINRPILEGSLGLAHRLGMRSVAEGVETEDDWTLLRELDCGLAQGWFVGRPMAAAQLPAWWEDWQARCRRLLPA